MLKSATIPPLCVLLLVIGTFGCNQKPEPIPAGQADSEVASSSKTQEQPSSIRTANHLGHSQSSPDPKVAAAVQAHANAIGEQQALSKIKTIKRTGTVEGQSNFGALSGTVEEIADIASQRSISNIEFLGGYSRQSGWDRNAGWVRDPQAGISKMPADESAFTRFNIGASPLLAHFAQQSADLKIAEAREFNGKQCDVITSDGAPLEYFIDQETKLLEGLSVPGKLTVTLADYQSHDGIQLPNKRIFEMTQMGLSMKYTFSTTIINAEVDESVFANPSSVQAKNKPASKPPVAAGMTPEQIIEFMDKNGDGKIALDESTDELKKNFKYVDTNQDGQIDVDEAKVMVAYAKQQAATSPAPPANASASPTEATVNAKLLIIQMDKDNDAKINKTEADEDLKLYFGKYDKNSDGFIDEPEALAIAAHASQRSGSPANNDSAKSSPTKVTAESLISDMDLDGDGKISKTEAPSQVKENFKYIDANGDGMIDLKEAEVMATYANQK